MLLEKKTETENNHQDELYEAISRSFSTSEGQDRLLLDWSGEIHSASPRQSRLLWACSIQAGNEQWQDALWQTQAHQNDPVLHSTSVIMSGELDQVMASDKNRKITAYHVFARKFKESRPELLDKFEETLATMALSRAVMSMHIEDQRLLGMFSSRPGFAWMKFGGKDDRKDLAQELASILDPIVAGMAHPGETETLTHVIAPSVLSTIKHCCKAGMVVSGTSGLALGKAIGEGVRNSPHLFKPVLDCWLEHGGAWQTLMIVQPDLADIISQHPKVNEKLLGSRKPRPMGLA